MIIEWQKEEDRLERELAELNHCTINGDDLSNEVKQHGERYRRCTQNAATARRILKHWVRQKAKTWGTLCDQARLQLKEELGKVPTDKAVEQRVRGMKEYVDKCTDVEDTEYLVDRWSGLVDSYKTRGFNLRETVDLALSSMGEDFIRDESRYPARRAYNPEVDTSTEQAPARRRSFPS